MKNILESIEINNFRSIVKTGLEFKKKKQIYYLIGKNESGKSNILNAINSINDIEVLNDDDRNFNNKEPLSIKYHFTLPSDKLKDLYEIFSDFNNIDVKNLLEISKEEEKYYFNYFLYSKHNMTFFKDDILELFQKYIDDILKFDSTYDSNNKCEDMYTEWIKCFCKSMQRFIFIHGASFCVSLCKYSHPLSRGKIF